MQTHRVLDKLMALITTGKPFIRDLEATGALALYAPLEGGFEGRYLRRLRANGYETLAITARGWGCVDVSDGGSRGPSAPFGQKQHPHLFHPPDRHLQSREAAPQIQRFGAVDSRGLCAFQPGNCIFDRVAFLGASGESGGGDGGRSGFPLVSLERPPGSGVTPGRDDSP